MYLSSFSILHLTIPQTTVIMTICKVGYTLETAKFWLQFKSACQKKVRSPILEERTDWNAVMMILLESLERHYCDTAMVMKTASMRLEEWAMIQPGGEILQLRISVDIKDGKNYRQDGHKSLCLNFSDLYRTSVMFSVRRKTQMSSLRSLAAARVASRVVRRSHLRQLEVPRDVLPDMEEAFDDSWRIRRIDTSPLKRKITDQTLDDLRGKTDCPFCGRRNFKRILTHITRNEKCHLLYKSQLNYNFIANNCFW